MVDARLCDEASITSSKGLLLRALRQNAKYLTPGRGITLLSLVGLLLRNGLASLIVHGALLVLVLQTLLFLGLPTDGTGLNWVLCLAVLLFGVFLLISFLYLLATVVFEHLSDYWSYKLRRFGDVASNVLLILLLITLTIGVLPFVDDYLSRVLAGTHLPNWLAWLIPKDLHDLPPMVGVIAALLGALGNFLGFLQTRSAKKPKIPTGLLIAFASSLLLFGALLIAFHLVAAGFFLPAIVWGIGSHALIWAAALGLLVLFGLVPDINYVSIHRYYRDRLMETFMPDLGALVQHPDKQSCPSDPGNETLLGRICGANSGDDGASPNGAMGKKLARGPYHIINANIVLVSSKNARYRGRGGDNFILSPLFTGSSATGWHRTDPSQDNGLTLASAMAISGAAISPNAGVGGEGVTRQPVLSVLMSLFNVRMGYWLQNPNPALWQSRWSLPKHWSHPNLIDPGLFESFGRFNLKESLRYVLLTDGGHFENLGLYELVRRRLKLIVVCDATADPDFNFSDLANAIEKVRADFGALIEIKSEDLRVLVPDYEKSDVKKRAAVTIAEQGYLTARIRYARRHTRFLRSQEPAPDDGTEETGLLVYLNTTFFKGLCADLYGYRRGHSKFPDQSTSNQFFDEKEFEAYRELGFQTALRMLEDIRARAQLLEDEEVVLEFLRGTLKQ